MLRRSLLGGYEQGPGACLWLMWGRLCAGMPVGTDSAKPWWGLTGLVGRGSIDGRTSVLPVEGLERASRAAV